MKISIITATYNSYPNILDTINCLEKQLYKDIEYIVIDGKSKDKTIQVIQECKKVDILISEPDRGIYDALNKGIEMATGDVIGFIHSDDLFSSDKILSDIIETFEQNDVDGVYGDLQYVDKDDTNKVIRHWRSQNFKSKLLRRGWMPAHPTLFLKRQIYEEYGKFDLTYKIAADYEFMLRIFRIPKLRFAYLPKVVSKMRVGGVSNRNFKNILKKSIEDYRAIKMNKIGYPAYVLFVKNISKITQFINK